MLIDIGYKRDLNSGVETSGNANGTFWYNPENETLSELPSKFIVEDGDRIVSVSVAMIGSGVTEHTAQVTPYIMSPDDSTPYTRASSPITVSNGGLSGRRYVSQNTDIDLSSFVGRSLIPASGVFQPFGGRLLWDCELTGFYGNPTVQFPETLTTSNIMSTFPAYYLTIERPAPEGYLDIVVSESPVYGDDRSVVKDFTGDVPVQGDQLRYRLKSLYGADVTVNSDLTYSGEYPLGVTIPEQDVLYLHWWSGVDWIDYEITVVLEKDDEIINPFIIPPRSGVRPDTVVTSSPFSITGEFTSAQSSIVGGEYSINGGEWISTTGTISPNDSVQVRLTSSSDWETTSSLTFTAGTQSADFIVTTRLEPTGGAGNKIQTFWMK